MKKILSIILLTYLLFGCVSLKKFQALERDYQKCGEDQRSYEQEKRIKECQDEDLKRESEKGGEQ